MIKTRLLKILDRGRKYVWLEILWQWLSLIAQIVIVRAISNILARAYYKTMDFSLLVELIVLALFGVILRLIFDRCYTAASFKASVDVKTVMRKKIYEKLLRLGSSYRENVPSSQITQMMGEGVEQLEIYFGKYISQFIYALLAPLTLFMFLAPINLRVALVLLIIVPLIPMVIMVVMKIARKLLDGYFKIYYGLGDTFLEKLNGMTALKIYQADGRAAKEMDDESERFRKITMKVLSMQLNSTIIMDVVAYGGAAVGMAFAISEFAKASITLQQTIMFLLLAAEFFLPMRLLGSFFHIGMNGMKAADRMFEFLDLEENNSGDKILISDSVAITIKEMSFAYDKDDTLKNINMEIPAGHFVSIVGVSGSGKSTIAKILRAQNKGYRGSILINGIELKELSEKSLFDSITTVSLESYIFPGTVKENLLLGNENATDDMLLDVLRTVNLCDDLGLDYLITEGGNNISGGQRQRIALARAILKDSNAYIFDEATSNIDVESEEIIMNVIQSLSKQKGKTIILISHRLANVVSSDEIFMLKDGCIDEHGPHSVLIQMDGEYKKLFNSQRALESYAGGDN